MTATLYPENRKQRTGPLQRNSFTGWKTWVVPVDALAALIQEKHHLLETDARHNGEPAWKEYYAGEIAATLKCSMEAARRRLWGVLAREGKIVNVTFADAACMALGLDLDRDTDIPTLPGNMKLAVELVRVRSGLNDDLRLRREAKTVIRLSALILQYPHNQARLQDLAPYDCLRPYR